MARKVSADAFSSAISKVIAEYSDNVQENLGEITKQLAKRGAKEVKAKSRTTFGGSGKYANGLTSRYETGRFSAQGTIYNGAVPGLPHLLENGHAKRGGGRPPGRVHIAPVEEEIVKQFENEVKSKL